MNASAWKRSSVPVLVLVGLLAGVAAATDRAAEHTKDTLETVQKKLKEKKALLVDVRELKEWDEGHVSKARLLPLSELKKEVDEERLVKLFGKDKKRILYVHCAAGGRCLPAAEILRKHGYDARPLKAGYKDLLNAGFAKANKEEPSADDESDDEPDE